MGQVAEWSHETVLAAECASASRARDFVCLHLVEHKLLYLVEDVRLVVSELATNALDHAHTTFLVRLEQADQVVLLTVQDGSSAVPRHMMAHVMNSGGRGMNIVALLSSDWGVIARPGRGKAIWAAFTARRAPAV
jgi:anti-sigma regulatory factor (Ser/Thr protein kinase)